MTKLDDLIKELCPDGVEYKTIGETYTRLKGTPITAEKMKQIDKVDGDIRVFAGGKTVIDTFEKDIPNANITRVPAVLVQSRGVIDVVYYEKPFTFKNEMWAYTTENKISVKYLYYVLKNNIQCFRESASGMGSLPQISLKVTENFSIPVPPLPVQEEIVRILDKFTSLEAELEAELEARRRQYEYYRDSLLTRETKVEIKKLGEICSKVENIKWKNERNNSFQYIDLTSVDRETHEIIETTKIDVSNAPSRAQQIVKEDDVLFGTTRPMLKRSTFIGKKFDGQICSTGYCVLRPNQEVVKPRYIYHHINSSLFYQYVKAQQKGASYPAISDTDVKNYSIPLPPLEVQKRIVNVLDNFDAICSDLKIGLPAEIEVRKKQYEYYRDLLLTFAERGNIIFTEQNRTEQNRTEQNRTEQNRTEQNRTEQCIN